MLNSISQWLKNSFGRKIGLEVLVSLSISTMIVIVRQLGGFEYFDLGVYDWLLKLHTRENQDNRILTVLITEDDIQTEKRWPISDGTLAKAINILLENEPYAIGVDLYRDFPIEPGTDDFTNLLANSDRVSVVCKLESEAQPAVPPPPSLPIDLVGFADIVIDGDGVVRRNLFYVEPQESRCPTPYSLALQLALSYLIPQGIEPQVGENGSLILGKATLKPIDGSIGAYRQVDASGYQIMLDYRRGNSPTPTVTLNDVLQGKVDPKLIKDKVILIGVSAPSLRDSFYTPFSRQGEDVVLMPGVTLHSYMVSQFLSSAIDGHPLIWSWSNGEEIVWIYFWGLVGSASIFLLSRPLLMILLQGSSLVIIVGSAIIFSFQGGWIPVVPAIVSFMGGAIALVGYNAYKAKNEQLSIQQQVSDQEKSIAVLQMLLKSQSQTHKISKVTTYEEGSVIVGRYQIIKRLGKGGFGNSYLSVDQMLPGKPYCVVKRLNAYSDDTKILTLMEKLLETEAKILEKVGKHPQIPDLLAYIQDNNNFFLVQEYIDGQTLIQELKDKTKYSENEVLQIIEEIMEILSFIEQYNLVHRDIKPDNILRRQSDKSLVLIDFGGIKQIFNLKNETAINAVSNEGYASPEQLAGQPVMASDIYSVGMVAIHCLTGKFPGKLPRDPQTGEILWDSSKYVSPVTAKIIKKMTSYHFKDRYQNAQEVSKDLKHYRSQIEELKNQIDIDIEIDEEKKAEEVSEIVHSENFLQLQEKAERLRRKRLS
ncbi:CHASE2 domain-containing serine/threonine-protein kinase [Cyanobacterium aponinum]|uniref:CHASE2 domain-containing serine/threonine-protein kinase n=1 Tax=Cyanobacterium aponinum TaxID=379064 RepID=UPI000C12BFC5|nr:CHASE2 domain-containing serine/threonine-protein kinase [Cyanobacterium aponinum]PHV62020.1 serine/threonine protein kinase [Cyanobacterium aponinum IPPAS B-1201]